MLTIGLLGDTTTAARRLSELNHDHIVSIVEQPPADAHPACQLVIGIGDRDDASADVWLNDNNSIDELWWQRIVPFAANLAASRRARRAREARLTDPDPTWAAQAQRLIARLAAVTDDDTLRIDHIGSTSVPGLPAKNLIDIQVVVADMNKANTVAHAANAAGFVRVDGPLMCRDRHGIEHPEEVVVDADPGRPANVNIRAVTAPIWRETLVFRDWLRANADARADYLTLKRGLAARTSKVDEYSDEKIPWISAAADRADAWANATGWTP